MSEILVSDERGQRVIDGFSRLARASLAVSREEADIFSDLDGVVESDGITSSNVDSVASSTLLSVGFDMLNHSLDLRNREAERRDAQNILTQQLFELAGEIATVTALGNYPIVRSYALTKPSEGLIEVKTRVHSHVTAPLLSPTPGSLGDLALLLHKPALLPGRSRRISAPIVNPQTCAPLVALTFSR